MSNIRLEEIAFSDIRRYILSGYLISGNFTIRCKPAAVLEDAEQWGSDKGVRGRLRDGGARERKRKGGFERARRVANRNEGPVCRRETKPYRRLFEESYEAAKCGLGTGTDLEGRLRQGEEEEEEKKEEEVILRDFPLITSRTDTRRER
ncbi:hypothetical protein ALC56_05528 [Trachymyrmex septentrionalis]|uniref:Uncharacterized protein n=1 Tax=Trachymyrmex septentrionalis TaxID=34720 RepID=A0A151JXW7_9HYME|nr:hypothetical protein ALC56_05528 [Trachymyrmex septentrionalis]